ncbi:MAG: DUF975 family protein [Oscillospiraceae bacterium]|nr:DUF975 family protein [Oscillospiraceae bacterium]
MKWTSDFRKIARDALRNRWAIAVLAGLLASLMGAIASYLPNFNFSYSRSSDSIPGISDGAFNEQVATIIIVVCLFIIFFSLVFGIANFIFSSIILVGYSQFNLDLVDGQKAPRIGTLFSFFPHWKRIAAAMSLRLLYVMLWSLLFIIPGIIANYSYAMTSFILSEHPELTASEALAKSKEMMSGNRLLLFFLELSFLGWDLLCILTLGVGNLWLAPYKQAAFAAFYREVSGTEYVAPAEVDPEI